MELKYKPEEIDRKQSFYIRRDNQPYVEGNWHYHEEYELIYIIRGEGVRIVGDNLSNFSPAQLSLVGSWVPHLWKNIETENGDQSIDQVVIKFNKSFAGQDIFSIPEFDKISSLIKLSERGLLFGRKITKKLHNLMLELPTSEGSDRIINLLLVLKFLSESNDYKILASPDFIHPIFIPGENRLSKIINFISDNFTNQISLEELANQAAMTPSSLCRFFKSRTNKTIFQFINEFRISKACHMLIAGNHTITDICFCSGFNSLTSFNRDFKEHKKITPREYKEKYQKLYK